jgi:1-acyl-sn-glycerol-3-phosphate acyltransferase
VTDASGKKHGPSAAAPRAPRSAPLYVVGYVFFALWIRLVYGLRIAGNEHVPRSGGCIIASNHFSGWDPPVVGVAAAPRQVHFMAKRELFASPFLAWVLRSVMAFPVDRTANDIGAVKEALRRLKAGHAVGIFFEGTRHADAKAVMGGAAFLAQRAAVPIVPAAIWREGRRFRVAFGPPLRPQGTSKEEAAALTTDLAQRVREMLAQGQERREERASR